VLARATTEHDCDAGLSGAHHVDSSGAWTGGRRATPGADHNGRVTSPDNPAPAGSTSDQAWHRTTLAVKLGRPPGEPDQPLNAPITMASTYVAGGEREYGRYANPTWEALEQAVGGLEGGQALCFASGMAAVSTVLDLVAPGETVVAARHCYQGTLVQLASLEQRGLVKVVLVDIEDTEAVLAALGDDVALLWIESPTNPALEVADIGALCAGAHDAGVRVVVDNTFATPLNQRPLELGADLVVHSGTKYLSGHADAMMGLLVTGDTEIHRALDERRRTIGALPGTLESWLTLRGIRTLHLRVERAQDNAVELVRRLESHPAVDRVRYPGLGGIVAIEVRGGAMAADLVTRGTSLWVHATSLGGVESTMERRRRWKSEPDTIPDNLIRLSVGVEDVEDLWDDLKQALDGVPTDLG
jgi:cystathionine gamma-synthase